MHTLGAGPSATWAAQKWVWDPVNLTALRLQLAPDHDCSASSQLTATDVTPGSLDSAGHVAQTHGTLMDAGLKSLADLAGTAKTERGQADEQDSAAAAADKAAGSELKRVRSTRKRTLRLTAMKPDSESPQVLGPSQRPTVLFDSAVDISANLLLVP